MTGKGLGTPTRLSQRSVGTTAWPHWSPDGKSLVYLAQREPQRGLSGASFHVILRSLATGEERELSPELIWGHDFYLRPSLSSDGRSIVLAARDKKGRQGIYTVDARTAVVTPVVRPEAGTRAQLPFWSPDGK
ncbi:MAG: PD40 domain-containing protein, partial [Planctomycetes bacterium]|nr:PD40 domain-containing protein [Planctomycetota bacterium]